MKKLFICLLLSGTGTLTSVGYTDELDNAMAVGEAQYTITARVKGLVCDFCARAIEKVFKSYDEVEGITVDLDKGLIGIDIQSGQCLAEDLIHKLITDSGYTVVDVNRACASVAQP